MCIRVSTYHRAILKRFPALVRLLQRIEPAEQQLRETQLKYEGALGELVPLRAAVEVEDHFADQRVKLLHLAAKTADGGHIGPNTSKLLPNGITPVVQPVGSSEITELRNLETRLAALGGPLAAEHLAPLKACRESYEAAVAARNDALMRVGGLREVRNAARQVWLDAYIANQGAIREAYPRDKIMQELFFDVLRGKASIEEEDVPPQPTTPPVQPTK